MDTFVDNRKAVAFVVAYQPDPVASDAQGGEKNKTMMVDPSSQIKDWDSRYHTLYHTLSNDRDVRVEEEFNRQHNSRDGTSPNCQCNRRWEGVRRSPK